MAEGRGATVQLSYLAATRSQEVDRGSARHVQALLESTYGVIITCQSDTDPLTGIMVCVLAYYNMPAGSPCTHA
jgi:hypothetical protein